MMNRDLHQHLEKQGHQGKLKNSDKPVADLELQLDLLSNFPLEL